MEKKELEMEELNNEDLAMVAGGTIMSGSTYEELKFTQSQLSGEQNLLFHPVIVTIFNRCSLDTDMHPYCLKCQWCGRKGIVRYCLHRSRECDPTIYL